VDGADVLLVPLALPQAPLIGVGAAVLLAEQLVELSVQFVFLPTHVQFRGQLPVTVEAIPA
jgi:hypothetical protein